MGTNFYLHEHRIFGPQKRVRHIGKSSAGWCFTLRVYPKDGINSLDDWKAVWAQKGFIIQDEYGNNLTVKEMLRFITAREWPNRNWEHEGTYLPYKSEAEFHARNHSMRGPNGLLRAADAASHGEGTWDCIDREFF